jgi:hypothetical protein
MTLNTTTTDAQGHPTSHVQPKVAAATVGSGVGAALSIVLGWVLEASLRIDIPEAVELAGGIVITAALTLLAGYLKRPSASAS